MIAFLSFLLTQQIAAKLKGIILINASQQEDISNDGNSGGSTDTDYLFHQKQKQVQQSLQFEQSMLKEREQRVRQIEEDVLDVNQIMRELNTLINHNGEVIGMFIHHRLIASSRFVSV